MTAHIENIVDGILIPEKHFIKMLTASYNRGISDCLALSGKLPDYYSMHRAIKIYGKKAVDHWTKTKLVKLEQNGRNYRLRRSELENAAAGSNVHVMSCKMLAPAEEIN